MPTVTRSRARAAAQPPPSTVYCDQFWNTDDVVLYTLRFLCLLDLVVVSHCSRRLNALRKAILGGRVARYVTPFFKPVPYNIPGLRQERAEYHAFFGILQGTRSWIIGSISLAVASVLSEPRGPHNLNIITSHLFRGEWIDFFEECGFKIAFDRRARGAYAHEGGRVLRFDHPDRPKKTITVTTSTATHIYKLFFSAPNTTQQVALAAHHIITPYPVMTSNQEGVQGWHPQMGMHPAGWVHIDYGTYFADSPFPYCVALHPSTEYWDRPCGEACGAVWRDTFGRKNIAQWSWGGVDGADSHIDLNYSGLGRSLLQFRIGEGCLNKHCKLSPTYVAPNSPSGSDGEDSSDDDDQ